MNQPKMFPASSRFAVRVFALLTVLAISVFPSISSAQVPQSDLAPAFFTDAAPPPESILPEVPSLRERFVNVDLGLLRSELKAASLDPNRKVSFSLFDDVVIDVPTGNFEHRPHGFSWSGSGQNIDGVDQIVVLTARDAHLTSVSGGDAVIAQFWSGSKRYAIQSVLGVLHMIYEIDTSLLAGNDEGPDGPYQSNEGSGDEGPSSPLIPTDGLGVGGIPTSAQPGAVLASGFVDVLVVHTQAARTAQPGMLAWIQNQIDQANRANITSSIPFSFRLAHQAEVTYTETTNNIGQDLDNLRNSGDNTIDNVHALRDDNGADVVVLVGSGWAQGQSVCGSAYQMNSPSTSFASSAFAVVDVAPGCPLTFVHEIGHNMALRHDWDHSDGTGSAYPYNHGLASPTGDFRTIMAYRPQGCVTSCPRIPNWSDPDVLHNAQPTGEAYNDENPSLTPQPEDNARAIAQTYQTVQSFRTIGSIGGSGSGDPAAVSWGAGRIDVFENNGSLRHKWFDAGIWSGWEDLGGGLNGGPAASSWSAGRLDVFVRGTDNALHHKWYDGVSWSGWESLGGGLSADPAAVSWGPNRIDVFVRGTDNALHRKSWNGVSWSAWENLGGNLTSSPAAASWGTGRLDVFARGDNNEMWHKWWDGVSWQAWESLGGALTSDPGAVSWGSNRIDVFVRGTDNGLWHKWYNGIGWLGFEPVASVTSSYTSGPDVASWAPSRLDVFARGSDNTIYRTTFT